MKDKDSMKDWNSDLGSELAGCSQLRELQKWRPYNHRSTEGCTGIQGTAIALTMGREICKSGQIAWIYLFEATDWVFEGEPK